MGFKRTSEGRVFFQGAENGANDRGAAGMSVMGAGAQNSAASQSPQMQVQIVTLLKTLNERLKATQADREKMAHELEMSRAMILELKTKADRHERAYQDLDRKLSQAGGHDSAEAELLAREALKELQETRKFLLELEDKANRADRGVASLTTEVIQTRKMSDQIRGKQVALENLQKDQAEKMASSATSYAELMRRLKESEEKQENFHTKLEETEAQQARLGRKVDKAMEDRARFMRKIERIEETVIQTRDSLNAKAMVLLTDQGVSGGHNAYSAREQDEIQMQLAALQAQTQEGLGHAASFESYEGLVWWKKPYRMQATGVAALVVACLLGGWWISEIQQPSLPDLGAYEATENADIAQTQDPLSSQPAEKTESKPDVGAMDWGIDTKNPEATQAMPDQTQTASLPDLSNEKGISEKDAADLGAPPSDSALYSKDDIGTMDIRSPEDVDALLKSDPASVPTALNAVEPTTPDPASEELPPPPKVENLPDPKTLMKADAALPPMVKKIETQAFAGVPEAQHDLAAIYTAGHGGVKQDYKRAAFWFEQAAKRNVANAAYNLGVLYHQGLGVKNDMKTALSWYERAANLGHPEAQYNLGIAYIEGIGVAYDPEKAAKYFTKAAKKNVMEAAYNLGLIYENGLLGEPKPDEALMWYKTAADQGSPEAKEALAQLAKTLNIKIDDVNHLVDGMKVIHKSDNETLHPILASAETSMARSAERGAKTSSSISKAPDQTRHTQQALVAQIQEYLVRLGLYPGPSDGVMGPLTGDSIRSYQKQNGLNPDGLATEGLLSHMLAHAAEKPL